jgi:hypothetical protein|tara:strand:- start:1557 stop:1727 length:171 start_codon:yes stop_codon:yes gene_type:complete
MTYSLYTLATIVQISERTSSLDLLTMKLALENIQALASDAILRAKNNDELRPCDSE